MTRSLFRELDEFRRLAERLLEGFRADRVQPLAESTDWVFSPAVETGWTDDYLNLRVVLPGVSEKDVEVTVQGNQLVIRGERKLPKEFGKEGYTYTWLPYGRFERIIELPSGLDLDKLEAYLHDGVLDIRVPVAEAVKPRQIEVKAGKQLTAAA